MTGCKVFGHDHPLGYCQKNRRRFRRFFFSGMAGTDGMYAVKLLSCSLNSLPIDLNSHLITKKQSAVKKVAFLMISLLILVVSCNTTEKEMNPLLSDFDTPFGVPPFDKIKPENYLPAFEKAMQMQMDEIDAIINTDEAPTFDNTIAAYSYSGELLSTVGSIFSNKRSADTNDELQSIAKEVTPMLSAHRSSIKLNQELFDRVKTVYEERESLDLNQEQAMLLEKIYKSFIRGGANLAEEDRENLKKIDEELSMLSLEFGENVLKETNNYTLVIDNEEDLAGLPQSVVSAAAEAATEAGEEGKWVFTLHKPSWIPFLQYAENRDLREKLYKAMYNRGNNDNEYDNKKIISDMVKLRTERARLLGYDSHADYILEERMAKTPENVNNLLMEVWEPAIAMAKREAAMMQEMIDADGAGFDLASWDWWFYAEKIRREKYDLDENEIRPYFSLDDVTNGVFMVVEKLYGVTFEQRDDIPVYHEDATAYEVKDSDGSHMGVLYLDFHPRASKRAGAWSTSYRKQHIRNGEYIHTVGSIVCNFSKPTGDQPALLSFDETLTLFHEMGHAIHGLFSDGTYPTITGTSVPRDFVELPSQIMENWGAHPEVLKMYAKHYETGEVIPDELVTKLMEANTFNMGFVTSEYLAASFLDMDYHTTEIVRDIDVNAFETEAMDKIGLIDEIIPRYKSTYFNHIFAGGYSAGYYSYIWSEVLDKDAFNAFEESGDLFNQELAASFRENILSKGGSMDAMEMYVNFRGKEPGVEPLLEGRGLN
jgi:peptidyl-dipeptidase Dcp